MNFLRSYFIYYCHNLFYNLPSFVSQHLIYMYVEIFQTWEDPNHTDDETGTKGDNDPLDVCEIGYKVKCCII